MIQIIVVDDHPVVREGLKRIIAESPGMSVVAEAEDGDEGVALVRNMDCDVVLLDLALPRKSGLDVLKEIHAEKPRVPVLVLSAHAEDQYAIRCLRAGAAGYLHKETMVAEVIRAIRKVIRGGRYVSQRTAEKIIFDLHDDARPAYQKLSDREYQIMILIGAGKTPGEIGEQLALSVKTVNTYRARVLQKLRVKNNLEIIRYAVKEGLLD